MSRILDVYLHMIKAGQLIQNPSGILSFVYDDIYLSKDGPALSISLPVRPEPYERDVVKSFFSGVLPDELTRTRLANYLGVSEQNSFALLEVVGGECAGALSLYPKGQLPYVGVDREPEVLDAQKLKEVLELLKRKPLLVGENDVRLSLAGAQDKLAVGLSPEGHVTLIHGQKPTTHILKPLISTVTDSVHNEIFCMRLAKRMGIVVPDVSIGWIGDTPYFLVERYDRFRDSNGHIKRIHQEDFCQALGLMPEIKYEREGGPGIAGCQRLIQEVSAHPAVDQLEFIKRLIFNYYIGNSDAHGKNFSLLYRQKVPALAPAYDLLSTSIYKAFSTNMAMKIGGHYDPDYIVMRHWWTLVADTVQAKRSLEKTLKSIGLDIIIEAKDLSQSLAKEGIQSPIFGDIQSLIAKRTQGIF